MVAHLESTKSNQVNQHFSKDKNIPLETKKKTLQSECAIEHSLTQEKKTEGHTEKPKKKKRPSHLIPPQLRFSKMTQKYQEAFIKRRDMDSKDIEILKKDLPKSFNKMAANTKHDAIYATLLTALAQGGMMIAATMLDKGPAKNALELLGKRVAPNVQTIAKGCYESGRHLHNKDISITNTERDQKLQDCNRVEQSLNEMQRTAQRIMDARQGITSAA